MEKSLTIVARILVAQIFIIAGYGKLMAMG